MVSSRLQSQNNESKYESCSDFSLETEVDIDTKVEEINEKNKSRCSWMTSTIMSALRLPVNAFFGISRKCNSKDSAFPKKNYYKGKDHITKLEELFKEGGTGFSDQIREMAKYIKDHDLSYVVSNWGQPNIVLISDPVDVKEILKKHSGNLEQKDSTGSFELYFPGSIFTFDYGTPEYTKSRLEHINVLRPKLKEKVPILQTIYDAHKNKLEKENFHIKDLEAFVNSIAMEAISFSLMGILKINASTKEKISEIIRLSAIEVCKPYAQVYKKLVPQYKKLTEWGWVNANAKLSALTRLGKDILYAELLEPNKENIRATKNWLNPEGDPNLDINSEEVHSRLAEFLVVGHETTAKLLFFGISMLAKHPEEVAKLREELEVAGDPEKWDNNNFPKTPRLEAFVMEVLRLFPPLPNLFYGVKTDFTMADGERHFKAGDLIVLSPEQTHKLKEVKRVVNGEVTRVKIWGDDAEEFNSSRHLLKNEDGSLKLDEANRPIFQKPDGNEQFTFGHPNRNCPGEDFARQEGKLIFARTIKDFDVKCFQKIADEMKPYNNPTYSHIVSAIPKEKNIHALFTPRNVGVNGLGLNVERPTVKI